MGIILLPAQPSCHPRWPKSWNAGQRSCSSVQPGQNWLPSQLSSLEQAPFSTGAIPVSTSQHLEMSEDCPPKPRGRRWVSVCSARTFPRNSSAMSPSRRLPEGPGAHHLSGRSSPLPRQGDLCHVCSVCWECVWAGPLPPPQCFPVRNCAWDSGVRLFRGPVPRCLFALPRQFCRGCVGLPPNGTAWPAVACKSPSPGQVAPVVRGCARSTTSAPESALVAT